MSDNLAMPNGDFVTREDFKEYKEESISRSLKLDDRISRLSEDVGTLRAALIPWPEYNRRHEALEERMREVEKATNGIQTQLKLVAGFLTLMIALAGLAQHYWK